MHLKRLAVWVWVIVGLIQGQSVQLSEIANHIPGDTQASGRITRIRRWLASKSNKLHSGGKAWPDLTVQRFAPAISARMLFPVSTHRQLSVLWMNRALFCGEHRRMKWPFEVLRRLVHPRRQHLEQRIEVQHCEQRNGKGWDEEHIVQIER